MRLSLKIAGAVLLIAAVHIGNVMVVHGQSTNGTGDPIPYGPGIADSGIALEGNTTVAGESGMGPTVLREALDNCADPANVNLSKSLAESADIVITGLVVVDAGTAPIICTAANSTLKSLPANPSDSKGPDLLLDTRNSKNGSLAKGTTLLVAVQCVHKGALACRRNKADVTALADAAGRCVIAVKVPSQTSKPMCSLYPGYRYMFMLSSKAAAGCDGAYRLAHSKVTDSIRPHLSMGGANVCAPYPSWPSQSTETYGDGLANLLSQRCPGAAGIKRIKCSDPCKSQKCDAKSGVTCVAKSCEGRYMVHNTITPNEACAALYISDVTGLPVPACNVTDVQLVRQHRQAQKRVGILTGDTETSVDSSGTPRIVDPQGLFMGRFGSALGQALMEQRQQAAAAPEKKP